MVANLSFKVEIMRLFVKVTNYELTVLTVLIYLEILIIGNE